MKKYCFYCIGVDTAKKESPKVLRHFFHFFNPLPEAHCGLAAPRDASFPFTLRRASAVFETLLEEGVAGDRLSVTAWGNARPLVLTFEASL